MLRDNKNIFDRDLALLSLSYKSIFLVGQISIESDSSGDFLKFTSIVYKGKCSLPVYFSISSFLIVVCKVKCSLPVYFSICVVHHISLVDFQIQFAKLFWNARILK